MGKPGRKKNAGVGVDFKKVKHKVGKKLPRAQNQTDTSFKSRTINLAEQSVAADKSGQAVTQRNLTLKEVLGQCGHYSERVRKDALLGLAELVRSHPEELRRHTTAVMEAAAERITDGDKGVRAALKDLLGSCLLPALGAAALAPFVPLLMAHVCAAMTHLAEPIRADALGFLELLMGARPDLVAAAFLAPVLQHFCDLLSKGSRGRSIKAGSLASLHGVVLALERFLSKALAALRAEAAGVTAGAAGGAASSRGGGSGGGAAGQQQQQQQQAGAEAGAVLMWRRSQWPPAGPGGGGAGGNPGHHPLAASAAEGSGSGLAAQGPQATAAVTAAAALLGHLLDCWSEAGPSQLAESPELVAAQCLTAILRSCDLLLGHWGATLAGSAHDRASLAAALLKKVAPHFPVQRPTVKVAAPVSEQLVLLNVAAAQLLARFLPGQQAQHAQQGAPGSFPGGGQEQPWVERLLGWFAGVMAEGAALPASDDQLFDDAPAPADSEPAGSGKRRRGGSSGGSGRDALPGEVYQSALDGTLQVLPLLPPERRQQLLGAAWQLWQRTSVRSGHRARVLAFWQCLLRDPAAAFYAPAPGGGPLLQHADVAAWLAALPRFLFELGSTNPGASQAALALLLGAARSAPAGSPLAAALQDLQPQLAPLFAVLLPAGAGGKQQAASAGPRVHVGPLAALPPAVQELAADLLYHFPAASEQLLRTAAVVALADAYPTSTAVRLLDVLAGKAAAGAADPAAFCGLLLNLLSGSSSAGLQQRSWQRHEALVTAACQAALGLGEHADVAAALLPPLASMAPASGNTGSSGSSSGSTTSSSVWASYGALRLSLAVSVAAAGSEQWQLGAEVAAALPHLMLHLLASCQTAAGAAGGSSSDRQAPSSQEATELCLQLTELQDQQLLPRLLAAVASSLSGEAQQQQQQQAAADQASPRARLLPAALQLLLALLKQQGLRAPLLEQQAGMQAALAACRAAVEAAGSATQGSRDCLEQLRQLEATCAAVLGTA